MAHVGQALAAPWVQTPAFLHDRARRVHSGLLALNATFDELARAGRFNSASGRWKAWKQVLANWGRWYQETSGTTWLWSATDATLESYEKQLQDWDAWTRRTFPEAGRSLPPPPPTFGPGGEPRTGIPLWVTVASIATGGFLLAKWFSR